MGETIATRAATRDDDDAIWQVIEPAFRAGDSYPLPRDISRNDALAYWHTPGHAVFVAEDAREVVGTYYLRANQRGGGGHVANCGYIVAPSAMRRGIARAMGAHSLAEAKKRGFRAMQFNFVIGSNERAVRLWQDLGFEIVGRLPGAYQHPQLGPVDAFVMFRQL
jgi:ribosomal protein S18 acetylase RimI-like enzyme